MLNWVLSFYDRLFIWWSACSLSDCFALEAAIPQCRLPEGKPHLCHICTDTHHHPSCAGNCGGMSRVWIHCTLYFHEHRSCSPADEVSGSKIRGAVFPGPPHQQCSPSCNLKVPECKLRYSQLLLMIKWMSHESFPCFTDISRPFLFIAT